MNAATAERTAAFITYGLIPGGYRVTVYDADSNPIDDYTAGNHPGDSQVYLPDDHPEALDADTLLRFAKQTAGETANSHGLTAEAIFEDE
jgi:hypothetical protein